MTNPHASSAPLPADKPVDLTQAQAAEVESSGEPADSHQFRLGTKSWPLVASIPFVRAANIQKALTDFDLTLLAEQLPSIVTAEHRDEVRDTLLADTEPKDPDHITMLDVVDAWTEVQAVITARPTNR